MHARPTYTAGFSLIEALVAIALLGAILVASASLTQGTVLSVNSRDEDIALKIATTEIDALRSGGYAALPASGSFTDPTLGSLPSGTAMETVSDFNTKTKQVDVTVSWLAQDATQHSVSLTTLVTQVGGL